MRLSAKQQASPSWRLNLSPENLGVSAEREAARFLVSKGHIILEQNFACRFGEIDIISMDGDILVFSEVRMRAAHAMVRAEESITQKKQRSLTKTALYYLQKNKLQRRQIRFDLLFWNENAVECRQPSLITNIF